MPEVIGPVTPKVPGAFKVVTAADLGGAFVKSVSAAGLATVQLVDGTEAPIQIAGGGTTMHFTDGVPAATVGADGDVAWDTTGFAIYSKAAGAWSQQFSVVGLAPPSFVFYVGTSDNVIVVGSELSVQSVDGVAELPSYAGEQYVLVARLASEPDIVHVAFGEGSENNLLFIFTKYSATVIPVGETEAFNVWITNNAVSGVGTITVR